MAVATAAAITAVVGAVGVGLAAYGSYQQYKGGKKVEDANRRAIALQMRQEELREKQMRLDAARRNRQAIRVQQQARSQALAIAESQGADQSSVLPGAYGGIQGQTGVNQLGIDQNTTLGAGIFGINRQITATGFDRASGQTQQNTGQGLVSLGGAIISNLGAIRDFGTQLAGPRPSAGQANPWATPAYG